jgi:hypothetical protein
MASLVRRPALRSDSKSSGLVDWAAGAGLLQNRYVVDLREFRLAQGDYFVCKFSC